VATLISIVFLAVLFALIGVGVFWAVKGYRERKTLLLFAGTLLTIIVGGFTGLNLYLMVICWIGHRCI